MSCTLELPLIHAGRVARMCVSVGEAGEWIVLAELDGREILRTTCSSWQRVEKIRARLLHDLEDATPGPGLPWRSVAAGLLLTIAIAATPAGAQTHDDVHAVLYARLADYLALRDDLRRGVAPEHIIDPHIREISGALLAVRIQKARAEAKVHDVFPAPLADLIRDRLHCAFDGTEVDVLFMNLYPDGVPAEATRLNMHYGETIAVAPPASVLGALPPLPGVLGYRLIGRDLTLWDEEAHLVVDIIVDALPEPRIWKFLDVSSAELRECVRQALNDARLDARDLVDEIARDAEPGARPPVVGEPFDWSAGNFMPPSVLHRLPPLPRPLEYRFVGCDLVVIDVDSGRVAGVLWNVLPRRVLLRDRATAHAPGAVPATAPAS